MYSPIGTQTTQIFDSYCATNNKLSAGINNGSFAPIASGLTGNNYSTYTASSLSSIDFEKDYIPLYYGGPCNNDELTTFEKKDNQFISYLWNGIHSMPQEADLSNRLSFYENKYLMKSEGFYKKWIDGQLEDNWDFGDWINLYLYSINKR